MYVCMSRQMYSFYTLHTQFKFKNRVGRDFEGRGFRVSVPFSPCFNFFVGFSAKYIAFSSHTFWTSSSLDVPAGVTQEEGHTGFLIHLLSAVRA